MWIIANVLGLSYGASIVMDEVESGRISKRDVNLLNMHIGISHSNVEDLALVTMVGASWWIVLCSRWLMSMVVVWCYRCVEQLLRRG